VELEAGLIGLVVGAVASGSVQSYLSRSDRRREGRNAARVLYMQLHEAESAIEELRPRRDWDNMITEWAAFGTTWSQYRESVAHVLNTPRFVLVDSAFAATTTLARARTTCLSQRRPRGSFLALTRPISCCRTTLKLSRGQSGSCSKSPSDGGNYGRGVRPYRDSAPRVHGCP
jgi:hypothetical protein